MWKYFLSEMYTFLRPILRVSMFIALFVDVLAQRKIRGKKRLEHGIAARRCQMTELKPCPFCGSDAIGTATDYIDYRAYRKEYWFAYCEDCGARGCMAKTEEDSVRYWNDRAEVKDD